MTDQIITGRNRAHGKTGVKSVTHHPELHLHKFSLVEDLTPLPASWDGTGGLRNLTMLGNGPDPANPKAYPDGVGDCVRVSEQNGRKFAAMKQILNGEPVYEFGFRPPHTPWTVGGYFAYGVAMGWRGEYPAPANEPDQGADPASYAKWMFKTGQTEVIAEVDVSNSGTMIENLRRAAMKFNGAAITVTLATQNMEQFDNRQPFTPGPSSNEGHGLWYSLWDPQHDWLATWAEVHPAELDWLPSVLTSAWVYGTRELFAKQGYDAAAIVTAAQELLNAEIAPSLEPPAA